MAEWVDVGLGLGGNLGDPAASIRRALDAMTERGHLRVSAVSTIYRTPPWGPVAQPDFANACALGSTDLEPRPLLAEIKAVEALLGRRPAERWGPRAIDIDILFYEGSTLEAPDLVIPHASLFERAFVLVPLAEIAPASSSPAGAWRPRRRRRRSTGRRFGPGLRTEARGRPADAQNATLRRAIRFARRRAASSLPCHASGTSRSPENPRSPRWRPSSTNSRR